MDSSAGAVYTKLETSRKELLDLGLRNPLLNYRLLRARGVEIVDELSEEVFRILVRDKKAMSFLPCGEALGEDASEMLSFDPHTSIVNLQTYPALHGLGQANPEGQAMLALGVGPHGMHGMRRQSVTIIDNRMQRMKRMHANPPHPSKPDKSPTALPLSGAGM